VFAGVILVLSIAGVSHAVQDSPLEAQTIPGKELPMMMQVEVTGEGRPIVLVPGGLTGWLSWIPHAKRLSTTRKVARVQLLSVQWGLEDRQLPPDYSIKTESHALAATIDSLGLTGPNDLVAWSFGGEVTLDYALDHPDRVRTLTLIEPPAFWVSRARGTMDDSAKNVIRNLGDLRGDISEGQLEKFCAMVGLLQPGQTGKDLPQWGVWMQHRRSVRNSRATFQHEDDTLRLKAFQPPVLLVKGTGSAPFLHAIIDALAGYFPHPEVVEYPAGHAPQIVSMDRFLEKLQSFQSSVSTSRRSPVAK
jgi:pimeloyl-ACP methyl ester carboxylesterase